MKPETMEAVARAMCKGVANFDDLSEAQADSWINAAEAILAALTTTPEYQAMVKDAERKECFWTSDGDDSPWEGSCGVAWIFIDGGPIENEVKYCPNCGGKLTAQTYDEVAAEDAAIDAARNG